MKYHNYWIEFYKGTVGSGQNNSSVADAFTLMLSDGIPKCSLRGFSYNIRDLTRTRRHGIIKGVFAKYRYDDIPHAGAPDDKERELPLESGEALIEKNFFLFFPKTNLLVYQSNRHGSVISKVEDYFSTLFNERVNFDPVLDSGELESLMSGKGASKKIELSFAAPTTKWVRENRQKIGWTSGMISALNGAGGSRISVTISTGRGNTLAAGAKEVVRDLIGSGLDASVARLQVEDERGIFHPVDLVSDRYRLKKRLLLIGRYPDPDEMYSKLSEAYSEYKGIFGE